MRARFLLLISAAALSLTVAAAGCTSLSHKQQNELKSDIGGLFSGAGALVATGNPIPLGTAVANIASYGLTALLGAAVGAKTKITKRYNGVDRRERGGSPPAASTPPAPPPTGGTAGAIGALVATPPPTPPPPPTTPTTIRT